MGNPAKAFLVLAASELRDNDLKEFFHEVVRQGPSAMSNHIAKIRKAADYTPSDFDRPASRSGYDAERLEEYSDTISKVESLLVREAGLAKTQAAGLLFNELLKSGVEPVSIPSPQKIAFNLWIARLCDSVPQSKVLHIASRLRNQLVHGKGGGSSWPLTER
jgi:hypothetical protein